MNKADTPDLCVLRGKKAEYSKDVCIADCNHYVESVGQLCSTCYKSLYLKGRGGHVWKAVIHSRTGDQKCGCPVCAGKVRIRRRAQYIAPPVRNGIRSSQEDLI